MLQHYFMTAWILKPLDSASVCKDDKSCHFELKDSNGLYSAAATVDLKTINPGQTASITVPLYAGPEDYSVLTKIADGLEYSKDYGWVHLCSPLFWLLTKLHGLVQNWGWAIVLLTLTVKAIFYPLTAAYRSMAKMKALAPRLERMKEQWRRPHEVPAGRDGNVQEREGESAGWLSAHADPDSGVHRPVLGAAGFG
jgi:YidC/Oxa1 family membrane protein insertase